MTGKDSSGMAVTSVNLAWRRGRVGGSRVGRRVLPRPRILSSHRSLVRSKAISGPTSRDPAGKRPAMKSTYPALASEWTQLIYAVTYSGGRRRSSTSAWWQSKYLQAER